MAVKLIEKGIKYDLTSDDESQDIKIVYDEKQKKILNTYEFNHKGLLFESKLDPENTKEEYTVNDVLNVEHSSLVLMVCEHISIMKKKPFETLKKLMKSKFIWPTFLIFAGIFYLLGYFSMLGYYTSTANMRMIDLIVMRVPFSFLECSLLGVLFTIVGSIWLGSFHLIVYFLDETKRRVIWSTIVSLVFSAILFLVIIQFAPITETSQSRQMFILIAFLGFPLLISWFIRALIEYTKRPVIWMVSLFFSLLLSALISFKLLNDYHVFGSFILILIVLLSGSILYNCFSFIFDKNKTNISLCFSKMFHRNVKNNNTVEKNFDSKQPRQITFSVKKFQLFALFYMIILLLVVSMLFVTAFHVGALLSSIFIDKSVELITYQDANGESRSIGAEVILKKGNDHYFVAYPEKKLVTLSRSEIEIATLGRVPYLLVEDFDKFFLGHDGQGNSKIVSKGYGLVKITNDGIIDYRFQNIKDESQLIIRLKTDQVLGLYEMMIIVNDRNSINEGYLINSLIKTMKADFSNTEVHFYSNGLLKKTHKNLPEGQMIYQLKLYDNL